jgi:hypothetical protein
MKLYTAEEPAPWIGTAEQIFRQEGAGDYLREDNGDDARRWMREFHLGSWALEHGIAPEEYVAEVCKHFTFLEKCGVALPSLEMQATEQSFSQPSFEHALYVSAAHVSNARYPKYMRTPESKQAVRELLDSLHTYVEWVHDSPQKLALFDILPLKQYLYGELEPGSPKRIYLIDVGPALAATQPTGGRTFQQWQDRLEDWEILWAARSD